jgi:hypothetical protein
VNVSGILGRSRFLLKDSTVTHCTADLLKDSIHGSQDWLMVESKSGSDSKSITKLKQAGQFHLQSC